ncbi:hypothetical protein CAC42_6198 [Sphaceloma murrayae]|uniref:Uncharacterized protein n=1 Tax=Sphaceloma murrayae TaxID=2082308 RepID=A0A2K1QTL9_9PEZI|nr:hypothetical protein CAC42_6198 [Sphaceloma murrayae]
MSDHKSTDTKSPPPYIDTTSPTDPQTTAPPAYDKSSTLLAPSDAKPRPSSDAVSLAPSAVSDDETPTAGPSTISSPAQTTWHIYAERKHGRQHLVVYDADKATKLYRISLRGKIAMQDMTTGAEIGVATFPAFSRTISVDVHAVRDMEFYPLNDKSRDYTYSSPALMRKVQWRRDTVVGHLKGFECVDERGDEVARWKYVGMHMHKVGTMGFARWVEVGSEEVVKRRREEVLFMGLLQVIKTNMLKGTGFVADPISAIMGLGLMGSFSS